MVHDPWIRHGGARRASARDARGLLRRAARPLRRVFAQGVRRRNIRLVVGLLRSRARSHGKHVSTHGERPVRHRGVRRELDGCHRISRARARDGGVRVRRAEFVRRSSARARRARGLSRVSRLHLRSKVHAHARVRDDALTGEDEIERRRRARRRVVAASGKRRDLGRGGVSRDARRDRLVLHPAALADIAVVHNHRAGSRAVDSRAWSIERNGSRAAAADADERRVRHRRAGVDYVSERRPRASRLARHRRAFASE